jgi:hypothetical protein
MKIVYVILLFCLLPVSSFGQNGWLNNDSLNIVTLIVDYQNYNFEGGNISYYDCLECESDSLPIQILYDLPIDNGSVTLSLDPTNEDVFYGTINWMSSGYIHQPSIFSINEPFINLSSTVSIPENFLYIDLNKLEYNETQFRSGHIYDLVTNEQSFTQKADSAWNAINSLKITHEIEDKNYIAYVFLYTPADGPIDYSKAKWVIQLYYKTGVISHLSYIDNQSIMKYDPFNYKITLNNNLIANQSLHYKLINSSGKLINQGSINDRIIDLLHLPNCIYLLFVYDENQNIIQSNKIIK